MTLNARGISLSQNSAPIYSRRFLVRIVINHTFTAASLFVPKQRAYWVQLQTVWIFPVCEVYDLFPIKLLFPIHKRGARFPPKNTRSRAKNFVQFWLEVSSRVKNHHFSKFAIIALIKSVLLKKNSWKKCFFCARVL